jgi:hypothetical protein
LYIDPLLPKTHPLPSGSGTQFRNSRFLGFKNLRKQNMVELSIGGKQNFKGITSGPSALNCLCIMRLRFAASFSEPTNQTLFRFPKQRLLPYRIHQTTL